jgi:all-trans-8'-apo-beta-carotenal 15,15'-oxygenase
MSAAHPVLDSPARTRRPSASARVRFDPPWLGAVQDLAREHAFEPLRVEGVLPAGLEGTLFRNGPGRFAVAGERYPHLFDGDGALSAVRIAGGLASGAARLVRTEGLAREERAGKRLFGGYGTPLARPVRELLFQDVKNTANTSVLAWQERLFALCEAGKPYEMDPRDLSTLGETSLGGVVVGAFSAHSHRVPQRRATYNFGLKHGRSTRVDAYELPDTGAARRIATFHVDGVRLNHDFVATERHLVFTFAPHYLSLFDVLLLRRPPVASAKWRPARGTEIVVVPIDDPERIRRFRVDAFYLEHVANAFEEGGKVVVDYTHYAHPDGLEKFVGGIAAGRVDAPLRCEVRRMTIDAERGTLSSEAVLAQPLELPRVSPLVDARRHRYTYGVGFAGKLDGAPYERLLKHDLESGRVEVYDPGDRRYTGEGVFVPRRDATAEDDGWLLTMVYDARTDRSCLEVLDARCIADGPVASCHFEHPIPFGFHGAWVPAG